MDRCVQMVSGWEPVVTGMNLSGCRVLSWFETQISRLGMSMQGVHKYGLPTGVMVFLLDEKTILVPTWYVLVKYVMVSASISPWTAGMIVHTSQCRGVFHDKQVIFKCFAQSKAWSFTPTGCFWVGGPRPHYFHYFYFLLSNPTKFYLLIRIHPSTFASTTIPRLAQRARSDQPGPCPITQLSSFPLPAISDIKVALSFF